MTPPPSSDTATDHPAVAAAWRDRRRQGLNPYPVLTPAGLVLGAGTVLAKRANDTWAPQALQIDAGRLLALLSIAYDRRHTVDQAHRILAKVQAAGRALAAGEPVQAAIHLAHAGLGALPDPGAARRLFLAEVLLDEGMSSDALMKVAGVALTKYRPDQPRDDHGRWAVEGNSGMNVASGPRFLVTPDEENGGLSRPLAARAAVSTVAPVRQWQRLWEQHRGPEFLAGLASAEESEKGRQDSFGYRAFKHNPNTDKKNPDIGDDNALGRYQILESSLVRLGLKSGRHDNEWDTDFGRANKIRNDDDFLNSEDAQESAIDVYRKELEHHVRELDKEYSGKTFIGHLGEKITITKSGLVAAAHRAGIVRLRSYLRKFNGADTRGKNLTEHDKWVETRLRLFQNIPYGD
ncbi:hypothetical protein [Azospirillum sp. B4]|uniref:hypothetical protein n=1 Tax=Azospirillum sp. B4 TaxID=95605 RepID=UPI000347B33C|nr:hypothetical protein [Azospirillum sp. B4]